MNISQWLCRQAQVGGERPALYLGTELVADYQEFHRRAAALANWLIAERIAPGDRVAIFMKNCPDYLIALYGVWYAGAAAVPINAKLHGAEAAYILENSGAGLVFTSAGLKEALQAEGVERAGCRVLDIADPDYEAALQQEPLPVPVACAPEDLAWLFYTSGTTGKPKGVMITHRMLTTVSLGYFADVDQATGADQILYAAPMSHGAGLYNMLHVLVGAAHVCPPSAGFDVGEILDLAAHFGRVQMFAAPTMVTRMTAQAKAMGRSGDGLRSVIYAGGPMYLADILEAEAHFGEIFIQVYGQGECPMGITVLKREEVADRSHPRWEARLAGVGRAQSFVEVQIGTAEGEPLAAGEMGEIMVRGDAVMPGYWRNPEANAETLRDGWLMTGDMGTLDQDGYLTMTDRSKDLIISGGSNVYPREVEEVILTHPLVQEASVVGRPHSDWGEEVVAFVVGSAKPEQLEEHCRAHIARFKCPKAYFQVPDLPKNNYGKVLKTELRARLLNA